MLRIQKKSAEVDKAKVLAVWQRLMSDDEARSALQQTEVVTGSSF